MKTFVIRARVSDGREFEYMRHTETAREALKSWFTTVRRRNFLFLRIREYAGTLSLRMVGAGYEDQAVNNTLCLLTYSEAGLNLETTAGI